MSAPELAHLPDIPNAGYSTRRERALSDSIMEFMRATERDRLQLLSIVVGGIEKWRTVGGKALRWVRADTEILDTIFHYFELQACRPAMQWRLLAAEHNPEVWRMLIAEAMTDIEAQQQQVRLIAKWAP